jgi:NAD(P)-dependent dehydrogenase (short-subunit alcohol dehydrogenase family)
MTDLSGKVAVVTGSARGIGKAIALRYASLGASVVINYSADEANARRTLAEVEEAGGRGVSPTWTGCSRPRSTHSAASTSSWPTPGVR